MVDYSETGLGKSTIYASDYDPALLQPITRSKARQQENSRELPFFDMTFGRHLKYLG